VVPKERPPNQEPVEEPREYTVMVIPIGTGLSCKSGLEMRSSMAPPAVLVAGSAVGVWEAIFQVALAVWHKETCDTEGRTRDRSIES
jgi:hypothetical protein